MKSFWKISLLSSLIYFSSWFLVYKTGINNLGIQSEDTLPAVFLPVTIINEGTLYLDNYYHMLISRYPNPDDKSQITDVPPHYLEKIGSHYSSAFPIMAGLLAAPVYLLPLLLGISVTWGNLIVLSHMASALIVGMSGGVLYLLLKRRFLLEEKKALMLVILYLFGTVNFAQISQALWQHGVTQFFTILGLYFLLKSICTNQKDYYVPVFLAGLFFGLAIISRPTALLFFVFLYLLLLHRYYQDLIRLFYITFVYLYGLIPGLLFFLWYNQNYYGSFSNQGYFSQLNSSWWSANFPEGFLGIWLSPSKGILVFTPVFIFSFWHLFVILKSRLKIWQDQENFRYIIFLLIIIAYTLIMGKWKVWWGGYGFGYRLVSDLIPFFILTMVPYIRDGIFEKTKKVFYVLFYLSILIQVYGIAFFDTVWHSAYDLGDKNISWLWSVKDSEFVFDVRRILVKFKVIKQACDVCLPGK